MGTGSCVRGGEPPGCLPCFHGGQGICVLLDWTAIFPLSCLVSHCIVFYLGLVGKPGNPLHDPASSALTQPREESEQAPLPSPQHTERAPKVDVLTVFGCASGDLERRSIVLLRLAPVTGVTSVKPMRSAFSFSPIKTRRAASAASCLPCFLLCAHTAGNQRPPTFAW